MKWLSKTKRQPNEVNFHHEKHIKSFESLYQYLAPLHNWNIEDYDVWSEDLMRSPEATIGCLRALKYSWENGRYGVLTPEDWRNND